MSDILRKSAMDLALLIKNKEVSPTELLSLYQKQIENVNPRLNAFIENNFDQAYSQAQEIEKNFERYCELPLVGVPFTAKEHFAVPGMKLTVGLKNYNPEPRQDQSSAIVRLQNAGAVLMGKTNIPELGFWWECFNPVYGRTNNPHDTNRTSGGSSGGEAALIAESATAFGVGSDVGGSIRIPASFCGVWGHKASFGLIPSTGHYPVFQKNVHEFPADKHPYTTLGPMARYAKDLKILTKIMSGPDGFDPIVKTEWIDKNWTKENLKKLKIYVLPDPKMDGVSSTHSSIQETVVATAKIFENYGAEIKEFPQKLFSHSLHIWSAALKERSDLSLEQIANNNQKIELTKELSKLLLKKANFSYPILITVLMDRIVGIKHNKLQQHLESFADLKNKLNATLDQNSLLIMPTMPHIAPLHNMSLKTPFDFLVSGIFCVTGHPATQIPAGTLQGMPFGIQLVGSLFNDDLNLFCADLLESEHGFSYKKPTHALSVL